MSTETEGVTAKNPASLYELVKNQPTELKIVSVHDLPEWGSDEGVDHMAVLVFDEGAQKYYEGTVIALGTKCAPDEKRVFAAREGSHIPTASKSE